MEEALKAPKVGTSFRVDLYTERSVFIHQAECTDTYYISRLRGRLNTNRVFKKAQDTGMTTSMCILF